MAVAAFASTSNHSNIICRSDRDDLRSSIVTNSCPGLRPTPHQLQSIAAALDVPNSLHDNSHTGTIVCPNGSLYDWAIETMASSSRSLAESACTVRPGACGKRSQCLPLHLRDMAHSKPRRTVCTGIAKRRTPDRRKARKNQDEYPLATTTAPKSST